MLSLSGEQPTPVEVTLDGLHWSVKTSTASATTKKVSCILLPLLTFGELERFKISQQQEGVFEKIHAEGYLSLESPSNEYQSLNLQDIFNRCKRIDLTSTCFLPDRPLPVTTDSFTDLYEELKTFAEYGPAFQRLVDGYQGENEVLVLVRGTDELLE
jgi:hypothetical protein